MLIAAVAALMIVVVRRGNSRTANTDGLRIEEQQRLRAHEARRSFSSYAVHNAPPSATDHYPG